MPRLDFLLRRRGILPVLRRRVRVLRRGRRSRLVLPGGMRGRRVRLGLVSSPAIIVPDAD